MQLLRVDAAGLQGMAGRWAVSVNELTRTEVSTGPGFSCQASAAAVTAAHTEVSGFTAALATRVETHATHVGEADVGYRANEADAANAMAALTPRVTGA
ncbi:hypothetical protein [Mycobacterium palustre]|uniref:Uncharacterized protein n=1 Tax=Mycobacterium palustre TaxID=153971 RepID=A0A1X1Z1W6_9MYCO|nr:hypothetical protein [Mycobacterium palustre]MCV7102254.1 hypothetical protein [Mycobacterium palustre]ORW17221.1 hypothetical protein AWC19_21230 [Mycobacterium palustre]